jgi:hypothetical protein
MITLQIHSIGFYPLAKKIILYTLIFKRGRLRQKTMLATFDVGVFIVRLASPEHILSNK